MVLSFFKNFILVIFSVFLFSYSFAFCICLSISFLSFAYLLSLYSTINSSILILYPCVLLISLSIIFKTSFFLTQQSGSYYVVYATCFQGIKIKFCKHSTVCHYG